MKGTTLAIGILLALAGCGRDRRDAAQAPAPDATAVDVAQEAQRLQAGMTRDQVIAILGEPRVRVEEPGGERLTFWSFDAGSKLKARVYVMLDEAGKVVEVRTIPL